MYYFYYHPESGCAWSATEKEPDESMDGLLEEIDEKDFDRLISGGMTDVQDVRVKSEMISDLGNETTMSVKP